MKNTKINYADHTFNPWIGCTKVSTSCDRCYAEVFMGQLKQRVNWGDGQPRSRTSHQTWRQPISWNRHATLTGSRPFVLCASFADVFDSEVDPQWRDDLFQMIRDTPQLVWLLLTKRIGNVPTMVNGRLPRNVAIGATMTNQEEYDRDSVLLTQVDDTLFPLFTFASFEPLLGPVRLNGYAPDWIIVGGETGSGARAMDLNWARNVRDQSKDLRRSFTFKRSGAKGGAHNELLDGVRHDGRPNLHSLESDRLLNCVLRDFE